MRLYRPEAFEPLTDEPWDDERVRRRFARSSPPRRRVSTRKALWSPVEDWDAAHGTAPLPLTTLYRGRRRVGPRRSRRRGVAETRLELATIAQRAYDIWRANPVPERHEPPVRSHAGLFDGDSGIFLTAYLVAPSDDLADALYARVRENWDNETNELMNGSPGTMTAGKAMLDRTGEARRAEASRESADELWRRRYLDGFWTLARGRATIRRPRARPGRALARKSAVAAAVRSGRATSERLSSQPTASTPAPKCHLRRLGVTAPHK
jgi:hypothetical protein